MPVLLYGNLANRSTVPVSAFDTMSIGLHQLINAFDDYEYDVRCDGEEFATPPTRPSQYDEIRVSLDTLNVRHARNVADELFDEHGWRADPPFGYELVETGNEVQILHGTDG